MLGGLRNRISRAVSNQDLDSLLQRLANHDHGEMPLGRNSIEQDRRIAQALLREARRNPEDLTKNSSTWLTRLFHLAYTDDAPTQQSVAETILELAKEEHLRVNLLEADLLGPLFHLATQSGANKVMTPAAAALEHLGIYSHRELYHLAKRKIEILRYLCACPDVRARRAAAGVLDSLLNEEDHQMDEHDFRSLMLLRSPR